MKTTSLPHYTGDSLFVGKILSVFPRRKGFFVDIVGAGCILNPCFGRLPPHNLQ